MFVFPRFIGQTAKRAHLMSTKNKIQIARASRPAGAESTEHLRFANKQPQKCS